MCKEMRMSDMQFSAQSTATNCVNFSSALHNKEKLFPFLCTIYTQYIYNFCIFDSVTHSQERQLRKCTG